jgi:hypothetical protein
MSERVLKTIEKATIYQCAAFGGQALEVAEVSIVVKPYVAAGNPLDELIIRFRKPRARKWEGYRAGDPGASFVVVRGWQAPKPPSGMVRNGNVESSRYGCFDPRYRQEFDAFVDRELSASGRIEADYRAMTREKIAALREAVEMASA